jgi:hypothetical protein
MKNNYLLLLISFLTIYAAVRGDELNTISPAEKAEGWKLLFDGKTLAGWRGYHTVEPNGWSVQDGALVFEAKQKGDLVTLQEYGDFELSFEWRISEEGNSGVLYRVALGDESSSRSGVEYQLLDNERAKDNKVGKHHAGAIYDLVAPAENFARPAGKWNKARVKIHGWKIEHWLNDNKVAEADLGTPAGREMIAGSKFKSWPRYASMSRGYIVLQDHSRVVAFRNLKIREL